MTCNGVRMGGEGRNPYKKVVEPNRFCFEKNVVFFRPCNFFILIPVPVLLLSISKYAVNHLSSSCLRTGFTMIAECHITRISSNLIPKRFTYVVHNINIMEIACGGPQQHCT